MTHALHFFGAAALGHVISWHSLSLCGGCEALSLKSAPEQRSLCVAHLNNLSRVAAPVLLYFRSQHANNNMYIVGGLLFLGALWLDVWFGMAGLLQWMRRYARRLVNDYRRARHRAKYPYAVVVVIVDDDSPKSENKIGILSRIYPRIPGLGYTLTMLVSGVGTPLYFSIVVLVFVVRRMLWPCVQWLWQLCCRRLVTRRRQSTTPPLVHLNHKEDHDNEGTGTFSTSHAMNGVVLRDGTAEHGRNGNHRKSPQTSPTLHDDPLSREEALCLAPLPVLRSCFKSKKPSQEADNGTLENQTRKPSRSVVFVDSQHQQQRQQTEEKASESASTRYYDYETDNDALSKQRRTGSTNTTMPPPKTAVTSTFPVLADRVPFSHAAPRNNGAELSSRPTMTPQSPGYKVVVQSSSLSTSVPSSGHKRVRALQEPLRVQRQQLLQQARLRKRQDLERSSTAQNHDSSVGDPVAKRQRMQSYSNQGRVQLSALAHSAASRQHGRPAPPIQNASQKRARQEQLLEQLSQPPPKRSTSSLSYHGPFGRLNRSPVPETQNNQPNAPTLHNLVTGAAPDASGATSTSRSSTESNVTQPSFTFGAHSSAAPTESTAETTEARPNAAESAVQTVLHSADATVPGPSSTMEAKPGFSFGTLNAPAPLDSAVPPAPTATTASMFSFGAQPTPNSSALPTLETTAPANQPTTTQPTIPIGDGSSYVDNAQNLFGSNQGGFATNFGSATGIQQHSNSGTESTSAAPVIQFGAPSIAAPAPTLTTAAPAIAPAFVFGSTSATTPPPGPVPASAAMGSFGTVPQFGMAAPPPQPSGAGIAVPQFGTNAVPQFGANAVPQFGVNAASAATGPMVFGANAAAPSTRPPPRRRNALRARRT
jgi:hypothetical protein